MDIDKKHPIGVVQRQTGLSTHVIRKWEERYQAITPERNSNGRRFYSSEDIFRLNLLKEAIKTGRLIGQVVDLSNDVLNSYIEEDRTIYATNTSKTLTGDTLQEISAEYLIAAKKFQEEALSQMLNKAYVEYGLHTMIDHIVPYLMHEIGDAWHKGSIRISHEHLATFKITSFLLKIFDDQKLPETAPLILSATLHDQNHTMGALITAIIARDTGWRSIFLGGNIPAVEIASAVVETHARVLILSFNYPYNRLSMNSDLSLIKNTISSKVEIIIGGGPVSQYEKHYNDERFIVVEDFSKLRTLLETIPL